MKIPSDLGGLIGAIITGAILFTSIGSALHIPPIHSEPFNILGALLQGSRYGFFIGLVLMFLGIISGAKSATFFAFGGFIMVFAWSLPGFIAIGFHDAEMTARYGWAFVVFAATLIGLFGMVVGYIQQRTMQYVKSNMN